jgi:hypothetical protein
MISSTARFFPLAETSPNRVRKAAAVLPCLPKKDYDLLRDLFEAFLKSGPRVFQPLLEIFQDALAIFLNPLQFVKVSVPLVEQRFKVFSIFVSLTHWDSSLFIKWLVIKRDS